MLQWSSEVEMRGRPPGGSLFEIASSLYGETVIEHHSVSDIAALKQHEKVERLLVGKN